jgi:hypothetical protein
MSGIELVYFDGCPHVESAREALREALALSGLPPRWSEWNQDDPAAPEHVHRYASPTILIEGRDVTGLLPGNNGKSCRADGVASAKIIHAALSRLHQMKDD